MSVKAIPEGFHTVTPSLACKNAAAAIEVYKKAFGAVERMRMPSPDGRIMHAEIQIGDSILFLGDEFPGRTAAPRPGALQSQQIYLYIDNVDATYKNAVAAGCKEGMPPTDMFWGDRMANVIDPEGHNWNLATHPEDGAPAEMARRGKEWMAQMAAAQKAQAAGHN